MIKSFLAFCLILSLTVPVFAAEEQPLGPIFDGVRKVYGLLPGLTLPYSREVITKSMTMLGTKGKGDLASGRIYFRPPHFLRMEQERPRSELLVTNGATIWWYVPEDKTVHKYPAKRFGQELRLLNDIFQGLVAVEERFAASYVGRSEGGEDLIMLRPDPPWEEVDRVVISVSPAHEIRRVEIYNPLGSTTIFTLGAPEPRKDFPEGYFGFVPPEGVKVVEDEG